MRTLNKLQVPNARAYIERQIVAGSESLFRFSSGVGENTGPNCITNACEDGFLECNTGTCLDNFDRTESAGSWGTGDAGAWQLQELGSFFETNMSVDGDKGIYTLVDTDQSAGFAWLEGLIATPPIEVLCKMAVEFTDTGVSNTIEFAVQIDGSPGPVSSLDWVYCFLDRIDSTGTTDNWTYSLEFSLQTSEGGSDDALGLFSQGPFLDSDNVRWDLWFRVRIEENGDTKARVWEDGDTEPGTWTMENLDGLMGSFNFSTVGLFLSPESDGVEYTTFEIDSFEVTEGCISSGGACEVHYQDGDVVILGEEGTPAVIMAYLTVSGSMYDTYTVPTEASEISNVWLDQLPTDVWDFVPEDNVIVFPQALNPDTMVMARYVTA